MYKARGFTILRVKANNEFQCIVNNILPVTLNTANAANDHLHEVKRFIQTIEECTWYTVQSSP